MSTAPPPRAPDSAKPSKKPNPIVALPAVRPRQPEYAAVKKGSTIRFTGDLELDSFSLAVHGAPDSGKTTFAITAPRPYVIATEKATPERIAALGLRIPICKVYGGYASMVKALSRAGKEMTELGARTIVVDTWTTLSDSIYSEILDQVRMHFAPAGFEGVGIEHFDPNLDGQIWNEVFRRQSDLRRRVDALGCSVVYVCHTRVQSTYGRGMGGDDESGVPDAQGQFRSRLLRIPGATLYVEKHKVKDPTTGQRRTVVAVYTERTDSGMEARCKWPGLSPVEPADLTAMLEKVRRCMQARRASKTTSTR